MTKLLRIGATCLAAAAFSGCTQSYLVKFDPQSHFDYPNSNMYPMGHVKGQASKSSFFGAVTVNSALQYDAISKALEQKPGADMLVNAFHFMDITQFLVLPITTVTYRVEGTAAKVKEIGPQDIGQISTDQGAPADKRVATKARRAKSSK